MKFSSQIEDLFLQSRHRRVFMSFSARKSISSTLVPTRGFLWSSETSIATTEKFQDEGKDVDTVGVAVVAMVIMVVVVKLLLEDKISTSSRKAIREESERDEIGTV